MNEGVRPPIVLYCLHLFDDGSRCQLTSWHGMDHWEVSLDRIAGMESGKYTCMMGPYCETHKEEHRTKKAG